MLLLAALVERRHASYDARLQIEIIAKRRLPLHQEELQDFALPVNRLHAEMRGRAQSAATSPDKALVKSHSIDGLRQAGEAQAANGLRMVVARCLFRCIPLCEARDDVSNWSVRVDVGLPHRVGKFPKSRWSL